MDTQIHQIGKLKKICKRCKTEYDDDNEYPVYNYCLKLLIIGSNVYLTTIRCFGII